MDLRNGPVLGWLWPFQAKLRRCPGIRDTLRQTSAPCVGAVLGHRLPPMPPRGSCSIRRCGSLLNRRVCRSIARSPRTSEPCGMLRVTSGRTYLRRKTGDRSSAQRRYIRASLHGELIPHTCPARPSDVDWSGSEGCGPGLAWLF